MVRVATSPSTSSFQCRYRDGSVWKSICLAPPARTRSSPAMGHPYLLFRNIIELYDFLDRTPHMHNNACLGQGLGAFRCQNCIFLHARPAAPIFTQSDIDNAGT